LRLARTPLTPGQALEQIELSFEAGQVQHLALQREHQPLQATTQGGVGAIHPNLHDAPLHHQQGAVGGGFCQGINAAVHVAVGHQAAGEQGGAAGQALGRRVWA
jgi:hypothetical protein